MSPYIQGPWEMDLVFFSIVARRKLSVVSCFYRNDVQIRVLEEEETSGSLFLFRWNEREDLITQLRQLFSMGITKDDDDRIRTCNIKRLSLFQTGLTNHG